MLLKKIYQYFFKAPWREKVLFVKAFFYSFLVRFLMLKVKYKRYEKYMGERGKESSTDFPEAKYDQIATIRKVVFGVTKNTPWESKCMVQALTCKWLLKSAGIESTIYYGIMPDPENKGKLKAHAWLRVGEMIATGREGHKAYKVVNYYS